MKLRRYLGSSVLALAFVLLASASALAKNSKTIKMVYDGNLSGTHLSVGSYKVQWENHSPDATVTFKQGKEVVLTTHAKVEERDREYNNNEVVYDTGADGSRTITEIRFAGSKEVLVFE
jgi:hypothetical protein